MAILKEGRLIAQGAVDDLLRRDAGIRLRVEGDLGRAIELIRALPWVHGVVAEGDLLLVDAPAARVAELNGHLARHDVAVAEIGARERSLEVFLP